MTDGYGIEEHEVLAVTAALVGDREPGDDAVHRYAHLSSRQALLVGVVARIADERAALAAGLYTDLGTYQRVADALRISRSRAQQLIERGR